MRRRRTDGDSGPCGESCTMKRSGSLARPDPRRDPNCSQVILQRFRFLRKGLDRETRPPPVTPPSSASTRPHRTRQPGARAGLGNPALGQYAHVAVTAFGQPMSMAKPRFNPCRVEKRGLSQSPKDLPGVRPAPWRVAELRTHGGASTPGPGSSNAHCRHLPRSGPPQCETTSG